MKVPLRLKFIARAMGNLHRPGPQPDIFLFATPRGGSTWLMEILASQPGMKFYDEPFNEDRDFAPYVPAIPRWEQLTADAVDRQPVIHFLRDLQHGRFGSMNPTPFRPNHRFSTHRIVFKLHELKHMMGDIARACRGCVVYLLRHPIPTSISRNRLTRVDHFARSEHYANLVGDAARMREIREVVAGGDHYQRAIASWCFENLDVLRDSSFSGLLTTYEELVMNPERSSELLAQRLQLRDRAAALGAFEQPSTNINMSHAQTFDALKQSDPRTRRYALLTKWRSRVTAQQQDQAAHILQLFELDAYDARSVMPHPRLLHFDDTMALYQHAANAASSRTPGA